MKLKDTESLKNRASEYCLSEEEYKRFCKIIDEEPDALSFKMDDEERAVSLEKAKDIVEDRGILDSGRIDYDYVQRMFPPTAAEFLAKYPTVSEEEYRKNPEKTKAFLESKTEKKKNNVVKFSKR